LGFNNNVWLSVINRFGTICSIFYTGPTYSDQWPSGRAASVQLANTANSFSNSRMSFSSGNLYQPMTPGGIFYSMQTDLLDPALVSSGNASSFGGTCNTTTGQPTDPLCGKMAGGILPVGGGLSLYNSNGQPLGAIGVAGDSPCYTHSIAWQLRDALVLDFVPGGVATGNTDNLIFPETTAWGHPSCGTDIVNTVQNLPTTNPISTITTTTV